MSPTETIGVDLGGTKLRVGVVDEERRISHEGEQPSGGLSEEEILDALEQQLTEARDARPGVTAAGLGIPCTIDQKRGVAVTAVNLPINDVPIRDEMRRRVGLPVYIDNDANLAALAEHRYGAARGADNAVMLTIGTGIGGGLILDRKVYRGSTGAGAELGHIVIDMNGPRCQGQCPNRGCAESLASGTAMGREGEEAGKRAPDSALGRALADGEKFDGKLVVGAAQEGDVTAREVVALIGQRLGVLLSSLANAFDPDVIVIGGGVSAAGELLLEPAREELRARALPPMSGVKVVAAELGGESGVVGAATMARIEHEAEGSRPRTRSRGGGD